MNFAAPILDIPALEVRDLVVSYGRGHRSQRAVHGVSFRLERGETLAIVGESGSGKTTTAQSIIGLLSGGRIEGGQVLLNGGDIARWSDRQLDGLRGSRIGLVPQDPGSSLNPIRTIGSQLGEMFRIHRQPLGKAEIRERVLGLLEKVGLSAPELRYDQYPHQLSGGMRQRVLIAMAIALEPELIIADEPTSALDVTVQKHILDLIDALKAQSGSSVLLVTHDLGVAADRADAIVVMQGGRIVEAGRTRTILAAPESAYTRKLLADAPAFFAPPPRALRAGSDDIVVVEELRKDFHTAGRAEPLRAVDALSFRVARGSTHAIVGESGSGKTTAIRMVTGFEKPTSGRVVVGGQEVTAIAGEARRQFRRTVQLVYQNPYSSLDPRQSIFAIVEEPLLNFEAVSAAERRRRVEDMIGRVGLPAAVLERRPSALSGGQRQRVAIARALILRPEILVLDEAVSALDVTVQARILELLARLQEEFGLTYIFVSHDLAVVRQIADTVSVMQGGREVERGGVEEVFGNPRHAYTKELIASIPGRRQAAAF
ncbi:dipeptide ABC transporter ATP-binding protein [Devosia honganensis]|uniref:Dipeptide ABC transporter ATP-binding protein n=1 Tax=Devosia honganensis TaxID=1610527 RepID=A0ABV7X225_9HYPH